MHSLVLFVLNGFKVKQVSVIRLLRRVRTGKMQDVEIFGEGVYSS